MLHAELTYLEVQGFLAALAQPFLPRTQTLEVLHGFGDLTAEQLSYDAACSQSRRLLD